MFLIKARTYIRIYCINARARASIKDQVQSIKDLLVGPEAYGSWSNVQV